MKKPQQRDLGLQQPDWLSTFLSFLNKRGLLADVSVFWQKSVALPPLPTRNRSHNQQWFLPRNHLLRQRRINRLVRKVLLARKKSQKWPPLLRYVVTNGAPQHRVTRLQRIHHRTLRNRPLNIHLHLAAHVRQPLQVRRQQNSNHGSVWTSTESTAGRSRTIGVQLSPPSAEAYTCPPLVPKYTPHLSSESTAIASRNTFT